MDKLIHKDSLEKEQDLGVEPSHVTLGILVKVELQLWRFVCVCCRLLVCFYKCFRICEAYGQVCDIKKAVAPAA